MLCLFFLGTTMKNLVSLNWGRKGSFFLRCIRYVKLSFGEKRSLQQYTCGNGKKKELLQIYIYIVKMGYFDLYVISAIYNALN
uniref:Uncharacterized protein n=1 Tax=Anguilla anguilla TaxID=7936 RepID=A0A0E9XGR3_ANGAN